MKRRAAPKPAKEAPSARAPGKSSRGGPTAKARQHQVDPVKRARELQDQQVAFEMTLRGFGRKQIAERLKCSSRRAARLVARGLDEQLADRDQLVHHYMAKGLAQADGLLRVWWVRATGYTKVDEHGEAVRDENGRPVVVEPDHKAAMVVARVLRDRNILIGHGQTVRVEHTGAGGGPIMTANISAMEAAMKVRQRFENAPKVILAVGQNVEDVPSIIASAKH